MTNEEHTELRRGRQHFRFYTVIGLQVNNIQMNIYVELKAQTLHVCYISQPHPPRQCLRNAPTVS